MVRSRELAHQKADGTTTRKSVIHPRAIETITAGSSGASLIKDQEVLRVLIAIVHPAHQSTIVPAQKSLAYYQDEQHHFYVPKKALSKIVTIL